MCYNLFCFEWTCICGVLKITKYNFRLKKKIELFFHSHCSKWVIGKERGERGLVEHVPII